MEQGAVRALERGLDILSCFGPESPSWGITRLARKLKLPKSSVHRLVATLEKNGFLRRNGASDDYELGFKVLALTGSLPGENEELRAKAAPYLRELHQTTSCTVSLRVMDKDKIVIVDRIEAPHHLRVVFPVGTHLPCNHGASGKLLMAYGATGESVRNLLRSGKIRKLTDRTATDPKVLDKTFEEIRLHGYAISEGEAIPGACGIAAPVFGSDGRIRATLSLTFPKTLSPKNGRDKSIRLLRKQAARLSVDLGLHSGEGGNEGKPKGNQRSARRISPEGQVTPTTRRTGKRASR
jgi:IclR family transcriptional regulator, KDG regulon repressor